MNKQFTPDGRTNRERMLAGDQYICDDPQLIREGNRAANLYAKFNATPAEDQSQRDRILLELLGSVGQAP